MIKSQKEQSLVRFLFGLFDSISGDDMSNYICNGGISLHDCRATKIETDLNSLRLLFPDGVWLLKDNSLNTVGKIVRTGKAEVTLKDFEFDSFTVCKPVRLIRKTLLTVCREVSFEKLRENINGGKWSVEFIDDFKSGGSHLFRVMLWQKNKWYNCLFEMRYEGISTRFDGVQQDRVW